MIAARPIYADHNATTHVRPEVVESMARAAVECTGNPSSLHALGRRSRRCLDRAREQVAALVGAADAGQIVFTGGGTEADNLALFGLAGARSDSPSIVTTAIEHPAVLAPCRELQRRGSRPLTLLPVTGEGIVDLDSLSIAVGVGTGVLSVMYVNNETGAVQPIPEIARIAAGLGVAFHVDAVQAAGKLPLDVSKVPVSTLALSAHKIGGPKGVGALFVRAGLVLAPHVHGGSQEGGRRPGTENVAGAVGFGTAAELATREVSTLRGLLSAMCAEFLGRLRAQVSNFVLNSPADATRRVPGTLNISFPGIESARMVLELDRLGVCVSSGSACSSGSSRPSHVLVAQGVDAAIARCAVRFSFGRDNTEDEVRRVADAVASVIARTPASPAPFLSASAAGSSNA